MRHEAKDRPAFPHEVSLRDWFAAQALAMGEGVWPSGHLPHNAGKLAENCYDIADAMLAEREKREGGTR